MKIGTTAFKEQPESRKASLRAQRFQAQEPIPTLFSNSKIADTGKLTSNKPPKRFVFTMSKSSILGFFLTLTIVATLIFVAGFLIAYSIYAPKPVPQQTMIPNLTKITPPPVVKTPEAQPQFGEASEESADETLDNILAEPDIEDSTEDTPAPPEVTSQGALSYVIELGASDDEPTARDMSWELQKHNIKTSVTQTTGPDGRTIYHIRGESYDDYVRRRLKH